MARSLHDLPSRSQLVVFGVLCVMAAGAAWQVLIGPARQQIADVQVRLTQLETEVNRARLVAMRLPAAQRELAAIEQALRDTVAVIPEEKDPQDVLRNLHELASESLLDIASFKPKPIVTRAQHTEWPIELGLEGSYHDLGRFFDRVAAMSRLISVGDLQIRTKARPTARGTVSVSCVATTYVFQKDELSGDFR
jgi:type IV pilus assembly protein PilO